MNSSTITSTQQTLFIIFKPLLTKTGRNKYQKILLIILGHILTTIRNCTGTGIISNINKTEGL